jgi:hypothetical protein
MQKLRKDWPENRRIIIIVAAWGLSLASISSQALFREAFLGPVELGLLLLVSFAAGALLSDIGKTILGYFASSMIAAITLYFVAISPTLVGAVGGTEAAFLQEVWISIMIRAFFPLPLIGFLAASVVGAAVGETYL